MPTAIRPRLALLLALAAAGCAPAAPIAAPTPAPLASAASVTVAPLPGGLDATPVFNSDSPETITQDGILLSTLPGDPNVHLDQAFNGRFGLFSHHVAHMAPGNPRPLHLALMAINRGTAAVTLVRTGGASYLTRPDAPYLTLPALVPDPEGVTYAGPGDRVATDLLHGRSPLAGAHDTVPPGGSVLVWDFALETTVDGMPAANGRSTLADFQSDGPLYLAEVARFATTDAGPTQADYQAVLDAGQLAGPRDQPATPFDPSAPPPAGGFRYGRVDGVTLGERWTGTLFGGPGTPALPGTGAAVGFPIASLYLNKLGSGQNQSAPVAKREPGSAYQGNGNYGVTYQLAIPLDNPDDVPHSYSLGFSSPLKIGDDAPPIIRYQSGLSQVTFRGPLRLEWTDPNGTPQQHFVHVVLHAGEQPPPIDTLTVPAHGHLAATLTLIYPADCTPPQLLTVARAS